MWAVTHQHIRAGVRVLHHGFFSSAALGTDQLQQQAGILEVKGLQKEAYTADSIAAARARIFGQPIIPGERTGRRALARKLQGTEMANWYFLPPAMPGAHNEEREQ